LGEVCVAGVGHNNFFAELLDYFVRFAVAGNSVIACNGIKAGSLLIRMDFGNGQKFCHPYKSKFIMTAKVFFNFLSF
jgi:hypothetical protein